MTKGCYMPNINAFRPVIHEKKMLKNLNLLVLAMLYAIYCRIWWSSSGEESPCPNDDPC